MPLLKRPQQHALSGGFVSGAQRGLARQQTLQTLQGFERPAGAAPDAPRAPALRRDLQTPAAWRSIQVVTAD